MSLVSPVDAPVVFVCGMIAAVIYRRWLASRNEDWFLFLGILVVGVFWVSLLVGTVGNLPVRGILPVVTTKSVLLAVFFPLAYPFWFWTGAWAIFLLFGRRPEQGGVYWLYRIEDRTEDYEPSWES
ncbi:hypothetical protein [Halovenus halobia]|uniref:hypothetical protein n=1 Tax=Halovenus halobia TaxID=3396622 RepID=UPI003F5504DB